MPEMRTYIVGAGYRPGALDAIKDLKTGERLVLRREPKNPHDRNAVAVFDVCGQQLGYIPRQDAPAIAKVIDLGLGYEAMCNLKSTTQVIVGWEIPDRQEPSLG